MLIQIMQRRGSTSVKFVSSILKAVTAAHSTASTVDTKEVIQFNKLDTLWWDELGQMKPLHSMNQLRVPFIRDGLINTGSVKKELIDTPKPLTDKLILEVGCGGGILTEPLARLGANITGIDASPKMIDQAKEHAKMDPSLSNVTYIMESIEKHAPENLKKYDAVVASEVLEHVTEKDMFLAACVKCVKPGGSVFITTLNKTTGSWLGGIIFAENIFNLVPRGTHDWNKFIAPHQTQKMLEDNQCRTRVIHGMCYNFITNTWSWTANTSINYALHAVLNI